MAKTVSFGAAHTYMAFIRGYTIPSPLGILAKAKGKDPYFTPVTRGGRRCAHKATRKGQKLKQQF